MALWLIRHKRFADYDMVQAAVVRARSQDAAWLLLDSQGRTVHRRDAYEFSQLMVAGEPEVIVCDVPDA
jgi:hypothetical protein